MARVIIQAGHYPRKTGATGTGGLDGDPTEQEFNLAAAQACVTHLRVAGHQASWIQADPPDSAYQGDAFVAIHCDGSSSPSAHGASVGYRNNAGHDFAQAWKQAYAAQGWVGWRPDNYTAALAGYYGTRHAVNQGNSRAIVVEAGFLTNPGDEAKLSASGGGPERLARSVTAAVNKIFGTTTEEDDMFEDKDRKLLVDTEDRVERELILLRDNLFDPQAHPKGRANAKSLIQGAVLDGLRATSDEHPERGVLRTEIEAIVGDVVEDKVRKVMTEILGPSAVPGPK